MIPARGGSKGIVKKNLYKFCDKPLIFWSILQAKQSKLVDKVVVTSDDDEILLYCQKLGVTVIKRPKKISGDNASSEEALIHATKKLNLTNDLIIFLQATSPLRLPRDIDNSILQSKKSNSRILFSGSKLEDIIIWEHFKNKLKCINADWKKRKPRQEHEKNYIIENGSIYIFPSSHLLKFKNRMSSKMDIYFMKSWQSFEIDTLDDLKFCEKLFYENLLNNYIS